MAAEYRRAQTRHRSTHLPINDAEYLLTALSKEAVNLLTDTRREEDKSCVGHLYRNKAQ